MNPPEIAIFSILKDKLSGRKLLDIGVGAGRTTPHLLEISRDYKGVDYSLAMIETAKKRYPEVNFQVADASQPFEEKDGAYSLIFFSVNGIDSLPHEYRIKALREFNRLLAPDGYLVFSSHNLGFVPGILKPWSWKRLHPAPMSLLTPLRIVKRMPRWIMGMWRCAKNLKHVEKYKEYSILNDGTEGYKFLQYYISIAEQISQLHACGYSNVRPFGLDGQELEPSQYDSRNDIWITYLCQPVRK
ncbi:MAG: class I SAM-dependent methyltransferase [Alphaproteobacteria bacterium]|nr:class I SAM-dependent methyltransferase [Alphaproteobacteria bacterium]